MLINCPECEKEISDKVGTICPNCGYSIPILEETQKKESRNRIIAFVVVIFIMFNLIAIAS